jgi:hypothetical protein
LYGAHIAIMADGADGPTAPNGSKDRSGHRGNEGFRPRSDQSARSAVRSSAVHCRPKRGRSFVRMLPAARG